MKIKLLIPTTSNKRNWKDVKDSYLPITSTFT